ncbi:hypothetical protein CRG98_028917, partial [Punica granatum]
KRKVANLKKYLLPSFRMYDMLLQIKVKCPNIYGYIRENGGWFRGTSLLDLDGIVSRGPLPRSTVGTTNRPRPETEKDFRLHKSNNDYRVQASSPCTNHGGWLQAYSPC